MPAWNAVEGQSCVCTVGAADCDAWSVVAGSVALCNRDREFVGECGQSGDKLFQLIGNGAVIQMQFQLIGIVKPYESSIRSGFSF